jgi:hypothetical protein
MNGSRNALKRATTGTVILSGLVAGTIAINPLGRATPARSEPAAVCRACPPGPIMDVDPSIDVDPYAYTVGGHLYSPGDTIIIPAYDVDPGISQVGAATAWALGSCTAAATTAASGRCADQLIPERQASPPAQP